MTAPKHSAGYPSTMLEALLTASTGEPVEFQLESVKQAQALRAYFYAFRKVLKSEKSEHTYEVHSVRLRVNNTTLRLESAATFSNAGIQAAVTAGLAKHAENTLARIPPVLLESEIQNTETEAPPGAETEIAEVFDPELFADGGSEAVDTKLIESVLLPKQTQATAPKAPVKSPPILLNFPPKV